MFVHRSETFQEQSGRRCGQQAAQRGPHHRLRAERPGHDEHQRLLRRLVVTAEAPQDPGDRPEGSPKVRQIFRLRGRLRPGRHPGPQSHFGLQVLVSSSSSSVFI